MSLHAGLICLDAPAGMDLALQRELFSEVLEELDTDGDLTNQILEVTLDDSEAGIQIERYGRVSDGVSPLLSVSPLHPIWFGNCEKQLERCKVITKREDAA